MNFDIVAVGCLLLCSTVYSFMPTNVYNWADLPQSTMTHQEIAEAAIRRVAKTLMSRYPDLYPNPSATLLSDSFKQARKQFLAAVASPDDKEEDVPEAHFNNEQFAAATDRLTLFRQSIVNSVKSVENRVNARQIAGRALHGLQDFYSHTNWMELGNTAPYPELWQRRISGTSLASPSQSTCTDCTGGSSSGQCRNNILDMIVSGRLLTSGYYSTSTTTKCRHGGSLDIGRFISATGGINKDSDGAGLSPHNYLHQDAARVAVDSAVEFLESIRAAVVKTSYTTMPDEDFAEFIGIPFGNAAGSSTLCFVIDTTGSMGSEIYAVKEFTINITRAASTASGGLRPSDYVLSPFSDPGFGPLLRTTNATAMIAALSALTATGGGDEPELAFHGLQSAVNNIRVGSTCYMFTDASAKDTDLYPAVLSQCVQKNVKIMLFYSGGYYRRRRSTDHRTKRATTGYSYYDDLAASTGGKVIPVTDSTIGGAVYVVSGEAVSLKVTVFSANIAATSFSFYVDSSMSNVSIQLSYTYTLYGATFRSPSGLVYTNYTTSVNLANLKVYNLGTLQTGLWNVTVSYLYSGYAGYAYTVDVTASSIISFTYQIARYGTGTHPGYFALTGNPIAGTEYYVVADVFGAFNPITDAWTNALRNVSAILFVNTNGTVNRRLPVNELSPYKQYMAQSVLSTTGFRVVLEGSDSAGNIFRRFDPSIISAVVIKLDVTILGNGSYSLLPGESITVAARVTNIGSSATWSIRVSDTARFFVGSAVSSLRLNTNQSSVINMVFRVPLNYSYIGVVSTATISAGLSSSSTVENYEVLYISVRSPMLDTSSPLCNVDRTNDGCPSTFDPTECGRSSWSTRFRVQDIGSGLQSVSVKPLLTPYNYSLQVDPFSPRSNATVYGTYSASCCYPNVTINVLDAYGNLGSCFVNIRGSSSADVTPPSVTAVSCLGQCRATYDCSSCQTDTWQTTLALNDTGSGLKELRVETNDTAYTLTPATLVSGANSAVVTYKSTCCHQAAVVTVYDVSGNRASLRVTATKSSDTCSVYAQLKNFFMHLAFSFDIQGST